METKQYRATWYSVSVTWVPCSATWVTYKFGHLHLHCHIVWDYPIGIICLYLHQPESHQLSVRKREESKVADEKQIGCWGWEATLVLTLVVVVVGPRRERLSRVDEPEFREQLVPLLDHQHHTIHQSPTKNSHRWAQQWHVHINKNWTYICSSLSPVLTNSFYGGNQAHRCLRRHGGREGVKFHFSQCVEKGGTW